MLRIQLVHDRWGRGPVYKRGNMCKGTLPLEYVQTRFTVFVDREKIWRMSGFGEIRPFRVLQCLAFK